MHRARSIATPLLAGTSLLLAVTGALLFFHVRSPLAHVAHEWLSWLFVAAALLHVAVNARPLAAALRPHLAKAAVAAFALLALAAAVVTGPGDHRGGPPESAEAHAAVEALSGASLAKLALALETSPGALREKLEAGGLRVPADHASIREIASASDREPREVLDAVFR